MIFDALKSSNKTKEIVSKAIFVISIVSIIAGLIILTWFIVRLWKDYDVVSNSPVDIGQSGQVGDYIGGVVGSVWSLSGVLLFFLALRLQSQEIANQIRELKETKEVFMGQQFESTFFNLLKIQHELINNLKARIYEIDKATGDLKIKKREGRDFFRKTKSELKFVYSFLENKTFLAQKSSDPTQNNLFIRKGNYKIGKQDWQDFQNATTELEKSKITYRIFFERFHYLVGHYFRHLFHTLKFIDQKLAEETGRHGISEKEKKIIDEKYETYAAFVQAQMSAPELFLLFYNALCFPKAYRLVEKFKLLENLAYEDLIKEEHKALYSQKLKSRRDTLG